MYVEPWSLFFQLFFKNSFEIKLSLKSCVGLKTPQAGMGK